MGPVTRPLYAVQRQLRRAAEALSFHGSTPRGNASGDTVVVSTSPITGKLFLTGNVAGTLDAPRATFGARIENAALGKVPLSEAGANAVLTSDGTARFSSKLVPADQSGSVVINSSVHVPDFKQLDARVEVRDAGMAVLSELAGDSATWVDGKATLSLRATGDVAAPMLSGRAQVRAPRSGNIVIEPLFFNDE